MLVTCTLLVVLLFRPCCDEPAKLRLGRTRTVVAAVAIDVVSITSARTADSSRAFRVQNERAPKNSQAVLLVRHVPDVADCGQVVVEPQSVADGAAVAEAVVEEVALEPGVCGGVLLGARGRFRGTLALAGSVGCRLA